jgi:hypothetical protein
MSQPFSGMPNPGAPRPFKRRFQPRMVQETLRAAREALRRALPGAREALRGAQRYGENLWLRGKRSPRTFGLIGAAVALTLVGAYALSASGTDSLCPPAGKASRKAPRFHVLMDPVPGAVAGSEVEIHYDVCGLSSGTPYRGRVRLSQQQPAGQKKKKKKKGSAKPKPAVVVTFQDKVDGPATRRSQQLALGSTKPGAYTLELSVVDNQGRERKRVQKVLIKAQ